MPFSPEGFLSHHSNVQKLMKLKTQLLPPLKSFTFLLFLLFSLGSSSTVHAQLEAWIVGPEYICSGESVEFYIENNSQEEISCVGATWTTQTGWQEVTSDGTWITYAEIMGGPGEVTINAIANFSDGTTLNLYYSVFIALPEEIVINSNASDFCSASEGSDDDIVCVGTTVTYTISDVSPNGTDGQWIVVGSDNYEVSYGDSLYLPTLTVTWDTPGIGYVEYMSYGFACQGLGHLQVEVLDYPEADFTTTPEPIGNTLEVCQGQTVYFENTSTGAATYEWNFGGAGSTEVSPNYTFSAPGTYEVVLVAYNECLCTDTTSMSVMVTPSETPFLDCVSTICAGETVTYTTDADCGSYDWVISNNGHVTDGGGANDNFVTIDWVDGPEGSIQLEVSGCTNTNVCLDPVFVAIPILSGSAAIDGPVKVCRGQIATYSIPNYEGTDINWMVSNFGTITEGQGTSTVTIEWYSGNTIAPMQSVSVDYQSCFLECGGSAQLDVNIRPEFYIEGAIEVCAEGSDDYQAINTQNGAAIPGNWVVTLAGANVWSSGFGVSNPTIDWSAGSGVYTVQFIPDATNDFCGTDYEIQVIANPLPPAISSIIGETNICPNSSYSYEAMTSETNTSIRWTINNGGVITERIGNPVNVNWEASGPYELSVIQVDNGGVACESDVFTEAITALTGFTISGDTEVCLDQISTLSTQDYQGVDYLWEISPASAGTIIEDPNSGSIEVLWHETGTVTIDLSVCGNNASYQVAVHDLPEPIVIPPAILCANEVVPVTTTAAFDSYAWKDENGVVVSTSATPDLGPGYYNVEVTNQYGCFGNTDFYIEGHPASISSISTPNLVVFCPGWTVEADLYAVNSSVGYSFQWFMDGTAVGTDNPIYSATAVGDYWVEITDANGCMIPSNTITLVGSDCTGGGSGGDFNCSPFDPSFAIVPEADCNVRSYVSTTTGQVAGSETWIFSDPESGSNSASGANVTHTFSKAGFYKVYYFAQFDNGTEVGSCGQMQVDTAFMAADFEIDNACFGEQVQFDDLSTFLPFVTITDWAWDFGDPGSGSNTSTDQNPSHTYATPGTYNVTLTTTADNGCTSTRVVALQVYPPPGLDFLIPGVTCANSASNFEALVDASVTSVTWDFGDPASGNKNTSSLFNTYHAFENPGTYTVTLTVQSIYGCTNNLSKTITIEPNLLSGDIALSGSAQLCEGETVVLTAPVGGTAWLWSDMSTGDNITVSEEGIYQVTVTDVEGCTYVPNAVEITVIAAPEAPIRAVIYNDYGQPSGYLYDYYSICEGEDVFLETIDKPGYSYTWSTGETGMSIAFSEDRNNLLTAGTYEYFIDVLDSNTGCANQVGPMTVVVHSNPSNIVIAADIAGLICESTTTTFNVVSPAADLVYVWSNGVQGTSMTTGLEGDYYVTAYNANGCETESNHLNIIPGPDITKIPSGCHTLCKPDTICLPAIDGIVSYQWYFNGTAIPAPEGNIEELVINESGEYYVEMVNAAGCTLTSDPLTADLYDGFGAIRGNVYSDVNENGIIDAGDTLVSNVTIEVLLDDVVEHETDTDVDGHYVFSNILSTDYTIQVDTTSLPLNLRCASPAAVDTALVGCDGLLELDWLLERNCDDTERQVELVFCEGESVDYNGNTFTRDTTFTHTFTSLLGCDSTVQILVAEAFPSTSSLSRSVCKGEDVIYEGVEIPTGTEKEFFYVNEAGCDSILTVNAIAFDEIEVEVTPESSCPNIASGLVVFDEISGDGPFIYSLDGVNYDATPAIGNLAAGNYTAHLIDENNCQETVDFTIKEKAPLVIEAKDALLPCEDQQVNLSVDVLSGDDGNLIYQWADGSVIPDYLATAPGDYQVAVTNGCETQNTSIRVQRSIMLRQDETLYIPTAFSPNDDGINDKFAPITTSDVQIEQYDFAVFDRWGRLLFQTQSPAVGWDGLTRQNNKVSTGLYVWRMKATIDVCGDIQEIQKGGEITLLR